METKSTLKTYTQEEVLKMSIENQNKSTEQATEQKKVEEADMVPLTASEEDWLDTLVLFGSVSKEVEIVPGFTVKMKTLTQAEREESWKLVDPIALKDESPLVKTAALNLPTLAYGITHIKGVAFNTLEKKKRLLKTLREDTQGMMIELLQLHYQQLLLEQAEVLDKGIKKN